MKLKVKFFEITHLPGSNNEFKTWTFKVKRKKKVVHDGFNSGPFFKTKKEARYEFLTIFNIDTLMIQSKL